MSKINIDAGNTPTIGKRMLFFIAKPEGGTKPCPARILDNYGALKKAPRDKTAKVNPFFTGETTASDGQVLIKLKVETADGDYTLDAYVDSGRSPGTCDEYKDGDQRV